LDGTSRKKMRGARFCPGILKKKKKKKMGVGGREEKRRGGCGGRGGREDRMRGRWTEGGGEVVWGEERGECVNEGNGNRE